MEEIKAYKVNGRIFESEEQARKFEKYGSFSEWFNNHRIFYEDDIVTIDSDDLLDWLRENSDYIKKII